MTGLTQVRSDLIRWITIGRSETRASAGASDRRRRAAAQGKDLADAGPNQARMPDSMSELHRNVERGATNSTRATRVTHQRRRRHAARTDGQWRRRISGELEQAMQRSATQTRGTGSFHLSRRSSRGAPRRRRGGAD
jgi:hypothetical protein